MTDEAQRLAEEALIQAREAFGRYDCGGSNYSRPAIEAIAKINEALAALAQPAESTQPAEEARDAARFTWLIENVRTGSIGFGGWWINSDEPASEWRSAIDAAMASTKEAR